MRKLLYNLNIWNYEAKAIISNLPKYSLIITTLKFIAKAKEKIWYLSWNSTGNSKRKTRTKVIQPANFSIRCLQTKGLLIECFLKLIKSWDWGNITKKINWKNKNKRKIKMNRMHRHSTKNPEVFMIWFRDKIPIKLLMWARKRLSNSKIRFCNKNWSKKMQELPCKMRDLNWIKVWLNKKVSINK